MFTARNHWFVRRTLVVASVAGVLASYGVAGPLSVANAASVDGSSFEIDTDANLVVNGGSSALDWLSGGSGSAMRTGVAVKSDKPTGVTDDSFTQGTKEDDTTPTVDTGSIPNNKADLTSFGVYKETTASATYLNVFWTRVLDPNGSTNVDSEFNQSSAVSNNPADADQVVPVRTAGDVLLTYDIENGGTTAVISRRIWSGTQWGAENVVTDNNALGSINTSAILSTNAGGLGALSPRTFGEASIDLAAFVPDTGQCITYGSVYVKSRSAPSFQSELKDFIAPEPVSISNCGSVRVHKTDENGALAGATFSLYTDASPVGTARGSEDTAKVGECTTNSSGDCSISNVHTGDYWLVETGVPAGHDGVAPQHVTITSGDQVVSFTLDDPVQKGTITVVKDAKPNDAQNFSFTLDSTSFALDDDADGTLPNTRSYTVPVGSHSLAEVDLPAGWINSNITCVDPSGGTTSNVAAHTATISLAKNETVTCTYENTFTKLGVGLATQAVEAVDNTSWDDSATMTGDGTHPVTGTVTFFACDPQATATACTTGGTQVGNAVPVTHLSGTSYGATTAAPFEPLSAGWSCFRAEYASTSDYYLSSSHTNATSECFLKQNADLMVSKTAVPAFGRLYDWAITKDVDKTRVELADGDTAVFSYTVGVSHTTTDSAWTVAGQITVTNPNPVDVTGVDVTDVIDNGAGSCEVTGAVDATVPANDELVLDYLCTYSSAPDPLAGTNTATATWDVAAFFTPTGTASGTADVDFTDIEPSVTNPVITVSDSMAGVLGTVDARETAEPVEFTYDVPQAGVAGTCTDYDNEATFVTAGENPQASGSASRSVTVCVGSDLTPSVTAVGSYDREDLWVIDKSVDRTRVDTGGSGTATFTYTVTATANGFTDSGWTLAGTVHVDNPNDWEDVTADVTVATDLGGGAVCTVAGGTQATVLRSAGIDLPYSCTFATQPAYTGTVSATASWDTVVFPSPNSSALDVADVTLVRDFEAFAVVSVVDDKTDPANPVELGNAAYADGVTTYTYTLTKPAPAVTSGTTCVDYTNVAVIVETQQSASQDVSVCSTFTGGGGEPIVNPPQGGGLPFTGDSVWLLARTAMALLLAGLVLLAVSRRRRSA